MGLGARSWSSRYSSTICGQSVSSARAASPCTAAMAAWSWYGPTRARPSVRVIREMPSSMDSRFQRPRSCSDSGTRPPSGRVRAGRRASVSQERLRDLRRGQTADRAQRERDLRGRGQAGMAAERQQDQRVIPQPLGVGRGREQFLRQGPRGDRLFSLPAGPFAAELVGHPAGGDRDQPPRGAVGHPARGPLRRGGQQRLLDRVLGGLEVAEMPHQRGEDLRRQPAQQVLDVVAGVHISWPDTSMIGCTSTAANRASGMHAAISLARSRLSQSTMR
jgi:hypothetical protein